MHHANYTEGPLSLLKSLALEAARNLGVEIAGNPDVVVRSFDMYSVEDSRELKGLASLAPVHDRKLFVIGAEGMTREAQNALLKLFEEPPRETFFFLLLPHGTLLPTLRSRCLPFLLMRGEENSQEAKVFFEGSYAERSKIIEKLLKEKERGDVRAFFDALERVLYEKKDGEGREEGLRDIARLRDYAGDRSPSLKMLLEHLAATLPR